MRVVELSRSVVSPQARLTACGLDDASFLEEQYPGVRFVPADGLALPFEDNSFDVVHSSAVIEHVGSRANQIRFIVELHRVARRAVCLTTPNRWFPVEVHTSVRLLHWLPPSMYPRNPARHEAEVLRR
jgi:SAM-dependent methyltransferase